MNVEQRGVKVLSRGEEGGGEGAGRAGAAGGAVRVRDHHVVLGVGAVAVAEAASVVEGGVGAAADEQGGGGGGLLGRVVGGLKIDNLKKMSSVGH